MNDSARRLLAGMTAVTVAMSLAACGGGEDTTASGGAGGEGDAPCEQVTLKLGHVWPEADPQAQAVSDFAAAVTESSPDLKIDLFPAGQIGGDRDILEGLGLGTTDMWVGGAGAYNAISDVGQFFVTPFMFDSVDDAVEAYNGELGDAVTQRLDEDTETTVLGFWARGPRHVTSKKPISTPADISGVRIRVPENPMFLEAFKALGANPTPMAFPEVFTALQQDVIDAQENPLAIIKSSGFSKVQSHLNLTGHIIEPLALSIADQAWDSLCTEQQEAMTAAVESVGEQFHEDVNGEEAQLLADLEAEGMTVVEPDVPAFREKVQPVRESVGADFQELYEIVDQQ